MATEKVKVSSFVPNSFQTPNAYVDEVMPFLTCEEYKVLIYATRRILGFQKRQDHISISQFTDGTRNRDGETLDSGTGLSISTVKNCLKSLVDFGLMVKVADNNPKTNDGILWSLQWDSDRVNWDALRERLARKQETEKKRISKARSVRQTQVAPQTPVSGTGGRSGSGTDRPPASGTETQKPVETHRKTETININPLTAQLFMDAFGQFNSKREQERWEVLYNSTGPDRAAELIAWASKKEIHLTNRPSLIDSLETAAKGWKTTQQRKQTAAQSGDGRAYISGQWAEYIEH